MVNAAAGGRPMSRTRALVAQVATSPVMAFGLSRPSVRDVFNGWRGVSVVRGEDESVASEGRP